MLSEGIIQKKVVSTRFILANLNIRVFILNRFTLVSLKLRIFSAFFLAKDVKIQSFALVLGPNVYSVTGRTIFGAALAIKNVFLEKKIKPGLESVLLFGSPDCRVTQWIIWPGMFGIPWL
jgi:hypothetical protein